MSNEQNPSGPEVNDRHVSSAYRDAAVEKAPEALNKAILQQAAAATKPRYVPGMSWMRPMAWAATIGLSLAIVLELSQLPQPESLMLEEAADYVAAPAAESLQKDKQDAVADLAESISPSDSSGKKESDLARASGSSLPSAKIAAAAVPEIEQKSSNDPARDQDLRRASKPAIAAQSFSQGANLSVNDEIARQRAENAPEPAATQRLDIASSAATADSPRASCDTAATTPDSWYECIAELEKNGQAEEADRQLEALLRAFPDFVPN